MPVLLTRRTFLERAACATALLSIARPATAADGWFVSLNGSLTRGVSGEAKVRLAAATGYGGVDWDLGAAKTAGLDATKALFAELKIKPTIINVPMARPLPLGGEQPAFQEALKQLGDDAAFTAGLGCNKMMFVLPASTTEPRAEYLKVVRDRLAAVAEVLQKSRIRLGLAFLGPLYFRGPRRCQPLHGHATRSRSREYRPTPGLDAWHWHHPAAPPPHPPPTSPHHPPAHLRRQGAPPADVRDNQLYAGRSDHRSMGFFGALKKIGYADGISPAARPRPAEMTAEAARLLEPRPPS